MTDSEREAPAIENADGNQPLPEGESVVPKPEEPHEEKTDVKPPLPEGESVAPKPEEPHEEKGGAKQPVPEYGIVSSNRQVPESSFAGGQFHPTGEGAQREGQNAAGGSPTLEPQLSQRSNARIKKLASSQTRVYAAIGVGLGLLVGLLVAVIFLHPAVPGGPNDMGSASAGEYGLEGHLATNWKEKLEYQLIVEPGDPSQRAAFAFDVNASPRPLSVAVQMKDPFGAVLCGDTILLKFDPRNAPAGALANPGPKGAKSEKDLATRDEMAQENNLARLESQELNREHGKNIFKNVVGADGQIASISAQGTIPCTRKQFENIASWSFTSDFPVVSKSARNQNPTPEPEAHGESPVAGESSGKSPVAAKSSAAGTTKRKPAPAVPPIYVEGDDAIVWFDASTGVIETSAGKVLQIDKTDAVAAALKGRDLPITIHYRCDQTGFCVFAGVGTGIERARLRR